MTTVAVTSPGQTDWASELERQRVVAGPNGGPPGGAPGAPDAHSMPDLSNKLGGNHVRGRPGSADLLVNIFLYFHGISHKLRKINIKIFFPFSCRFTQK